MLFIILLNMKAEGKFESSHLKYLTYFMYHANADNNQFIKYAPQKR